jgi:hypothetical protein
MPELNLKNKRRKTLQLNTVHQCLPAATAVAAPWVVSIELPEETANIPNNNGSIFNNL